MNIRRIWFKPGWGLAAALVIGAVVLVAYYPSLWIGFFAEDHLRMDALVRLAPAEYAARYLDPRHPVGWYRPVQGLELWIAYSLWGSNAIGYRVLQMLLHLANCLLLYRLAGRVTRRPRVALMAALVWAVAPAIASDFFWVEIADPLVALFYLLAIIFWLRYLQKASRSAYGLAAAAAALALVSKEVGATVPLALMGVDLWTRSKVPLARRLGRYWIFGLELVLYAAVYLPRLGSYNDPQQAGPYAGLALGPNLVSNLGYYVSFLAFPWQTDAPVEFMGLVGVLLLFVIAFARRKWSLLLLAALALLPVLPVLPFTFAGARYLYTSMAAAALLLAAAFDALLRSVAPTRLGRGVGAVAVGLIVLYSGLTLGGAMDGMAGFAREYRAPVRPFFQRHVQFAPGTLLYFVGSPIPYGYLSGMAAMRYGPSVTVSGTDNPAPAQWNTFSSAWVGYWDGENRIGEQQVASGTALKTDPALPAEWNSLIRLTGYEVANPHVRRGEALVVVLYWQAAGAIREDYTLSAQLTDGRGRVVAGVDGMPRAGKSPTGRWRPNERVVDWLVIPIPTDAPLGQEYDLQLGWYYFPTMAPLSLVDANGAAAGRAVTIAPISIE